MHATPAKNGLPDPRPGPRDRGISAPGRTLARRSGFGKLLATSLGLALAVAASADPAIGAGLSRGKAALARRPAEPTGPAPACEIVVLSVFVQPLGPGAQVGVAALLAVDGVVLSSDEQEDFEYIVRYSRDGARRSTVVAGSFPALFPPALGGQPVSVYLRPSIRNVRELERLGCADVPARVDAEIPALPLS